MKITAKREEKHRMGHSTIQKYSTPELEEQAQLQAGITIATLSDEEEMYVTSWVTQI
jgi:hypothetical protein